jgi:hypothetical protein
VNLIRHGWLRWRTIEAVARYLSDLCIPARDIVHQPLDWPRAMSLDFNGETLRGAREQPHQDGRNRGARKPGCTRKSRAAAPERQQRGEDNRDNQSALIYHAAFTQIGSLTVPSPCCGPFFGLSPALPFPVRWFTQAGNGEGSSAAITAQRA